MFLSSFYKEISTHRNFKLINLKKNKTFKRIYLQKRVNAIIHDLKLKINKFKFKLCTKFFLKFSFTLSIYLVFLKMFLNYKVLKKAISYFIIRKIKYSNSFVFVRVT